MTTINSVLKYLQQTGEAVRVSEHSPDVLETIITSLNTDRDAYFGELAWLSDKQARREPGRINTFKGSLLLYPEALVLESGSYAVLIGCRNPKLAFTQVVDQFFQHLVRTEWSSQAGTPIHSSARLATDIQLASGVVIGSGVQIEEGVTIGPNTVVANCIIRRNVLIGANCTIGLPGFGYEKDPTTGRYNRFPHVGRVIIDEDVEIGSNTCIDRGSLGNTIIERGAKIDNLVHIAHNVRVGANAIVIANSMVGGSTVLGAESWLAPSVSVMNQVTIGDGAILGLGAVVLKDVEKGQVVVGNPAKPLEKRR